ncbi:MAG: RNA-binding S4 domain-containing protein [Fusobacterium sp.]|uniref:RNA-binding S4 domain-containing protein n=1 Tax=Fusobacterium sp. TaxID=68766 RepID=UPI0026DB40A4|nr:RNA-binding S4 domain-containing protein [Fusobacterium sp.]MDO4690091.1 RNA-binding S4 domain-containing protein [Fusobacterium sp.]
MKKIEKIKISTEFIKLDQFLKYVGICVSGTEAKNLIINSEIKVNDEFEMRRGRKLYPEYKVEVLNRIFIIE